MYLHTYIYKVRGARAAVHRRVCLHHRPHLRESRGTYIYTYICIYTHIYTKYEERAPPSVDEFVYITDHTYEKAEVYIYIHTYVYSSLSIHPAVSLTQGTGVSFH